MSKKCCLILTTFTSYDKPNNFYVVKKVLHFFTQLAQIEIAINANFIQVFTKLAMNDDFMSLSCLKSLAEIFKDLMKL